jgi:UDP-N-acetylmuramoylalanine--D-glutamate ligase
VSGFGEAPRQVLVVGFARTGRAVSARLRRLGSQVVVVDDRFVEGAAALAEELGVRLLEGAGAAEVAALAAAVDLVVASPGVPPTHPALLAAPKGRLVSEIELAYRLSEVPIVAVTGTNGKTTVTSLAAEMLTASGVAVLAAGNIGTPLVGVVPGPGRVPDPDAAVGDEPVLIVAEVSSFQLALADTFRPVVGTWLNLAEDHLDWHRDLQEYAAAKERIWVNQQPEDVAVANAGDPVVMAAAGRSRARLVTFGEGGDYREEGGVLLGPDGGAIVEVERLPRKLPHDRANVLAAADTAIAAGATAAGCAAAAEAFHVAPHRVELVADDGVLRWFDDSKATTPSAVCAALEGFDSVVLIAGGRNKGLDLRTIRDHAAALPGLRVRAVVAVGEAAGEVEAAFDGFAPVLRADSMEAAVEAAAGAARSGDSVLLSPGCASFDWYASYAERGADFARLVLARLTGDRPRTPTGAGV